MSPRTAFYLLNIVGGAFVLHFMVWQLVLIVRRGTIERRQGLKSFTASETPVIFWGFVSFAAFACVGIGWGIVVCIVRLQAIF